MRVKGRTDRVEVVFSMTVVDLSLMSDAWMYRVFLGAVYVQSTTRVGDYHHPRGVVVAQVVKANIPVRNGVVHLIEKPLIIIDIDIVNFLKVTCPGRHLVMEPFRYSIELTLDVMTC